MEVYLNTLTLQIATVIVAASSINASAQTAVASLPNRFIESECDDSQRINGADSRYVLRATISDGQCLLWKSESITPFQVGSDKLTTNVMKIALALSVNLRGTNWELTSLTVSGVQTRVATKPRPTLAFDGARVSGNAGCNGFGGPYTQNANRLKLGQIITTPGICVDNEQTRLEMPYLKTLGGAMRVSGDSRTLTLTAGNGDVLVFTRVATSAVGQVTTALPNSSWNFSEYTFGTQRVTESPKPPTIAFDNDRRISGFSGCNRFTGGFSSSNSGVLKFTSLAGTRMTCTGETNTLEAAFLKILRGATRYSTDATTLKIFSSTGTLTFKRSR